ncbi:MAG: response regulator [Bacteroidota bacterium]|nr:response regulator [Bacteroidota bacterium]
MGDKILIIEDNKNLREDTAEILALAGYAVISAENGKVGLEIAKKEKPNLIVCDIMMPELDGYGVLRALENIPEIATTPLVFLTAKSEKEDFRFAMDLGADDYLTKPFSGSDLLKVVAARLKKNKLLKNSNETLKGLDAIIDEAKTNETINNITNNRTINKFKNKEIVFKEGDLPSYLYFVITGKIKIIKTNDSGKDYITELKKEGEAFGYTTLLNETKYTESAIAIEDTEIAIIPKKDFYQLLYSNSEVSLKFIKFISNNLLEAEERLIKLAYDSGRKKTAEAILFLFKKYEPTTEDGFINIQRENLSALAGISPETISRNLTDFKEEGLIEGGNRSLKIVDLKKLETIKN